MRTYANCLIALSMLSACSSTEPDPTTDAGLPEEAGTVVDASREARCEAESTRFQAFLSEHAACARDEECAIIGSCSNGQSFSAVNGSVRDEAQRMSDALTCKWADGPHYVARCELGRCVARLNGGGCGARESWCPSTHAIYRVDCSVPSDQSGTCFEPCTGSEDTRCAPGFRCQATEVVPVGKGCADPKLEAWLCRPAPSCEVALSIDTEDRPGGSHAARRRWIFRSGESAPLRLWAENLTLVPKTIRFRDPCPAGPGLTGLDGYDAWHVCTAGACPSDLPSREITIAPGERVSLGNAQVSGAADDCNPNGLGLGSHEIGFALEQLEGATVCGPEPLELSVQ